MNKKNRDNLYFLKLKLKSRDVNPERTLPNKKIETADINGVNSPIPNAPKNIILGSLKLTPIKSIISNIFLLPGKKLLSRGKF